MAVFNREKMDKREKWQLRIGELAELLLDDIKSLERQASVYQYALKEIRNMCNNKVLPHEEIVNKAVYLIDETLKKTF